MLDIAVTLWAVCGHKAVEANPLMAHYMAISPFAFVAAKMMTFVPAIFIAECYRQKNPRLITFCLRVAFFGYLVLYTVGVAKVNGVF